MELTKHNDKYGYIPTDTMYDVIIEWLKTGTKRWTSKTEGIITSRLSMPNSNWDVVVDYDSSIKMISWTFRESNVFHV